MNTIDLLEEQTIFLKQLELKGKSFNTVKNYKTDLNCFNKYMKSKGRDLHIKEFTPIEVKEYCSHLDSLYNSPNSIRRRIQALRIFFDYLLENEKVENNPLKLAAISPKRVDKPNPVSFSGVLKLYKYLLLQTESTKPLEKLTAYRNLVLIELIYGGGLKVSDIAILNSDNIIKSKESYRVLVSHPKRDPITIELEQNFEAFYTEYSKLLERQKQSDQIDFQNLFYNGNPYKILSGGLSPRGIEVLFKDFSGKINEKITAKSLRQSCIFKWIGSGKPDSTIKEWIGVQPQYSLKPFHDLLKESPAEHAFKEAKL